MKLIHLRAWYISRVNHFGNKNREVEESRADRNRADRERADCNID